MGSDDPAIRPSLYRRFLSARRHGSTVRSILFLGFTAIFALWLVSAYDLVQRVTDAERQAAAITTRFTDGEELLFTVRAQVLLSSVYARDAILDARPDAVPTYGDQLLAIRSQVTDALERYVPNVDSATEAARWTRLQAELQDYWASLSPLLMGQSIGTPADAYAFLRRDVIPRRDTVGRISDEIRTLKQDALLEQQAEVAAIHRVLRRRIWWTSGIAVVLGLGAAWLAARHAGRLERRIREQHVQQQRATGELQRLSAELESAQERERRTIARDLHDEIGQALMTVKLDLGTIERSGQVSGAPAQALAEARSTTELAIQTVRDLSQLLHPPMLDDFGLVITLEAYTRRFSDRTGIPTQLVVDGIDRRLPPDVEVCAYRVVQEALTNVAKHARARSCRVSFQRLPHSVLVSVEDDGIGVDVKADTAPGVGLVGVRERASRLGGAVRLHSRPGGGTRLAVEIPIAGESPNADAPSEPQSTAFAPERV